MIGVTNDKHLEGNSTSGEKISTWNRGKSQSEKYLTAYFVKS